MSVGKLFMSVGKLFMSVVDCLSDLNMHSLVQ